MTKYPFVFRFFFVGGSTALIFFGLTFTLTEGLRISTVLASTLACVIAVCYNYVLHYHWTFESEAHHGLALLRFLLMSVGGVLLNSLVMYAGTMQQSVHYMVVQLFAAFAMVGWSMCLSYFWVFRSRH